MAHRTYKEVWNDTYQAALDAGWCEEAAGERADRAAHDWAGREIDRADDERHERKLRGNG